jgi:glutathione S-transferase
MDTPLLWHIPLSHFSEKVRWALDYKGIAHRRRVLGPDYLIRAWHATGQGKLPVLWLDGRAIADSTRIIAALEERYPEPPLYPSDPAARGRALALEEDLLTEDEGWAAILISHVKPVIEIKAARLVPRRLRFPVRASGRGRRAIPRLLSRRRLRRGRILHPSAEPVVCRPTV